MSSPNSILIVGIDPKLIDFTSAEFSAFPGLTAEKVELGIKGSIAQLQEAGFEAELCWTDFGQTALSQVNKALNAKKFDAVLIGAGIRVMNSNLELFQNLINFLSMHPSKPGICFNANPADTAAAVQRWASSLAMHN